MQFQSFPKWESGKRKEVFPDIPKHVPFAAPGERGFAVWTWEITHWGSMGEKNVIGNHEITNTYDLLWGNKYLGHEYDIQHASSLQWIKSGLQKELSSRTLDNVFMLAIFCDIYMP